ncbi:protease inhibitor Inh/omp19 family protein [Notoacmeibacter sp. MSK16QG-6]|uniref:protease inhibitor Inh/omp19 family protein n=1 Tax=Notoacmeibacter sp. MSK16QG-6 TaxID=2957982 RepID=UPI00209FD086|nr:AprI/Inh family metalloprotease inhibitor [Notoacmeibacter sp. MSK16QG-6]MCP1199181.1 AprI/Inh family metalloprotease inhibitor [Notoacmeibacter sp. MSK16QG-6]
MNFIQRGGTRVPLAFTIAIGMAAMTVAGCTSSRFDGAYNQPAASPAPQPLQPAPVQTVQSNQLPPPVDPATASQSSDPNDPLNPPQSDTVDVAAVSPTPESSPSVTAAGAPISKGEVVGNWKTQAGGASCQMFLTLTKYGTASRGGTRGCSGDLANLRGWDVKGSQLVLYDESGGTIGRLYGAGPGRYSGQTSSGTPVTLSR